MFNQHKYTLHQHLSQLLSDRYGKWQELIERIGCYFVTAKDAEDIVKMSMDFYEIGYLKAVEDYRKAMEKLGLNVNVVPQKKE